MPDVRNIKEQKLLYHLTSVENLDGIFQEGLKPRAELADFTDVADAEILKKRKTLELDNYVPFHWFAANPFEGGVDVQPRWEFVRDLGLQVYRKQNGWKVILATRWLTIQFITRLRKGFRSHQLGRQ